MARLVWMGLGAVGAVVAAERVRRAARRYTPAAVTEQVGAVRQRTSSALGEALATFHAARARREADLAASLLVTPEGGDPHAVLRRGDRTAGTERTTTGTGATPTGRHAADDDEPLYEF